MRNRRQPCCDENGRRRVLRRRRRVKGASARLFRSSLTNFRCVEGETFAVFFFKYLTLVLSVVISPSGFSHRTMFFFSFYKCNINIPSSSCDSLAYGGARRKADFSSAMKRWAQNNKENPPLIEYYFRVARSKL